MTKEQINKLLFNGKFPETTFRHDLIETHISWVILCDQFVYKIKKPVHYSFLDFSTLELRKHFCQREIDLNKRLSDTIYMEVLPVYEWQNSYTIGGHQGTITDYAVKMHKLDRDKQMNILLLQNKVTGPQIEQLAKMIAFFHNKCTVIFEKDVLDIQDKFNDLITEKEFLGELLGRKSSDSINNAVKTSDAFIARNKALLDSRLRAGFFRDCHGDLHSRNIFLLPAPVPFDCIEFNDDFRQIDVLNEVAFLCMDLDAYGRQDLSSLFIEYYNHFFPAMETREDQNLFIYYKSYRANIRAKVNSLRAKSTDDNTEKTKALSAVEQYLSLMDGYLKTLIL